MDSITTDETRLGDLLRAQTDIVSIKKLLAMVAGVAFASIFGIGIWVGANDTKLVAHEGKMVMLDAKVSKVEERQRDSDIVSARIETRLAAIDAALLEIKYVLRK